MGDLRKSDYIRFFFIAFFIILMDFVLKKWMLLLLFEQPKQIVVTTFFNLTPVWNNGISFGLMSSQPEVVRFIIPILALLVITYLISQLRFQGYLQQLASAIISGGAVGNVIPAENVIISVDCFERGTVPQDIEVFHDFKCASVIPFHEERKILLCVVQSPKVTS